MAYRIRRKDKTVEVAVRRIAREQLAKALDAVGGPHLSPDDVHTVRLRCKKIRGLLRLVRPCFGRFAEEDARFRTVARRLAPARDRDVMYQLSVSLLKSQHDCEIPGLATLLPPDGRSAGSTLATASLATGLREQLQEAYDATPDWHLDADGWEAVDGGLRRTYRAARGKLRKAIEQPASENFHALRSHAKYHLFHTGLLVRLEPGKMKRRMKAVDRLCKLLGDDHDLSVLKHEIDGAGSRQEDHRPAEILLTLIRRQQAVLQPRAIHLAKGLFAQPTSEFVQDLGKRWEHWR